MIADQMDNLPGGASCCRNGRRRRRAPKRWTDVVSYRALPARDGPGKLSDADGGRHRDGHGRGAGFLGRRSWRTAKAWSTCWRGIPESLLSRSDVRGHPGGARAASRRRDTSVAWVEEHYPQAKGCVTGDRATRTEAEDDLDMDAPDGDTQVTTLLEFWYKQYDAADEANARSHGAGRGAGAAVQHGNGLRRGDGRIPEGLYAHGEYPFVLYKYRDAWRKAVRHGADLRLLRHADGDRPIRQVHRRQRAGIERAAASSSARGAA